MELVLIYQFLVGPHRNDKRYYLTTQILVQRKKVKELIGCGAGEKVVGNECDKSRNVKFLLLFASKLQHEGEELSKVA